MEPTYLALEKREGSDNSRMVTRLKGKLSLETVHSFIQTLRLEPAAHLILDLGACRFSTPQAWEPPYSSSFTGETRGKLSR